MASRVGVKDRMGTWTLESLGPDEVRSVVRDGLISMGMAERVVFVQTLCVGMRRVHFDLRAHPVPLGIPGRCPEDLTPTEVGHLIRYLKMTAPRVMPAIDRVIRR